MAGPAPCHAIRGTQGKSTLVTDTQILLRFPLSSSHTHAHNTAGAVSVCVCETERERECIIGSSLYLTALTRPRGRKYSARGSLYSPERKGKRAGGGASTLHYTTDTHPWPLLIRRHSHSHSRTLTHCCSVSESVLVRPVPTALQPASSLCPSPGRESAVLAGRPGPPQKGRDQAPWCNQRRSSAASGSATGAPGSPRSGTRCCKNYY